MLERGRLWGTATWGSFRHRSQAWRATTAGARFVPTFQDLRTSGPGSPPAFTCSNSRSTKQQSGCNANVICQPHHQVAPSASFPPPPSDSCRLWCSQLLRRPTCPGFSNPCQEGDPSLRLSHLSVDRLEQGRLSVLRSSGTAACVRGLHLVPIKQASVCRGSLLGERPESGATRRMKTILIGLRREVFTATTLAVSFRWP